MQKLLDHFNFFCGVILILHVNMKVLEEKYCNFFDQDQMINLPYNR